MKGRIGNRNVTVDPTRVRDGVTRTTERVQRSARHGNGRVAEDGRVNPAPASPYEQVFFFPGLLPGLNELLEARSTARRNGARGSVYDTMKQQYGKDLYWQLMEQKAHHVARAYLVFYWIERTGSRDPDNVAAGGRKILLDAMVKAGVLVDDSRAYVAGWEDVFPIDAEHPGVRVVVRDIGHMPAAGGQEH